MTTLRYIPNSIWDMNEVFNSFANSLMGNGAIESVTPRMDMKETDEQYQLKLTMPGIDPNEINITFNDGVLSIKAEKIEENESEKEGNWLIRERSSLSYARSVRIPAQIKADEADAEYKNGILSLTLPKAEEDKPKTIAIRINE